jgi:hypothetical protein
LGKVFLAQFSNVFFPSVGLFCAGWITSIGNFAENSLGLGTRGVRGPR